MITFSVWALNDQLVTYILSVCKLLLIYSDCITSVSATKNRRVFVVEKCGLQLICLNKTTFCACKTQVVRDRTVLTLTNPVQVLDKKSSKAF